MATRDTLAILAPAGIVAPAPHVERASIHHVHVQRNRPRTVAEAADELGLSQHTVRAWIAHRKIGYVRLGRAIRITSAEIQRVLQKNAVPADERRSR